MSGFQRLSVFLSVLWLGFWFVGFAIDAPPFNWIGFVLFGVAPLAVALGIPWASGGLPPDFAANERNERADVLPEIVGCSSAPPANTAIPSVSLIPSSP